MTDDAGALVRSAVDRLVAASARQRAGLARMLGLQSSDVLALHHIAGRNSTTPSELTGTLNMSSGGTTAVIDRLVVADLVTRVPGSGSRRRMLLRVTAKGRSVIADPLAPFVVDVAALTAELSSSERAVVERFLPRLADVAERHADRVISDAAVAAATTAGVPAPVVWG